jgi:hypothetical protein
VWYQQQIWWLRGPFDTQPHRERSLMAQRTIWYTTPQRKKSDGSEGHLIHNPTEKEVWQLRGPFDTQPHRDRSLTAQRTIWYTSQRLLQLSVWWRIWRHGVWGFHRPVLNMSLS